MSSNKRPKGGIKTTLYELAQVPVPPKTETYCPLPHTEANEHVLEQARTILAPHGFEFGEPIYRSYRDGNVAIAQLPFDFTMPGLQLQVQWVNSYNKMFRFTMTVALMVKACSNGMHLSQGTVVKARMHTTNILRDLNPLIIDALETAPGVYETGVDLVKEWNLDPVADHEAHDLILQARRRDIIGPSLIEPVLQNWIAPPHDEFVTGTRWALYNAFTEAMKGLGPEKTIEAHRALTSMFQEV